MRVVVRSDGPLEVAVAGDVERGWSWWVANDGPAPVRADAVSVVWELGPAGPAPRFLRHGYSSWSPTAVAVLGRDTDPASTPGSLELTRGIHHADSTVPEDPAALRSELVTVLDLDAGGPLHCVGSLGATEHDATVWARLVGDRVELRAEAFLGGTVLAPGERRELHPVTVRTGEPGSAPALLEAWAAAVGEAGSARVDAPYQVGWCSWYHYYGDITEEAVLANLALGDDWPFEVFQVDDGYQSAIGDWTTTDPTFPSGLAPLAAAIAAAGRTPGLWLAPFLAAPGSRVVAEHPDWVAVHRSGKPLVGMVSPGWGGPVLVLDTTRADVLAHVEDTARELVAAGYPYLKLDFTYAPTLPGTYADVSQTPAQRVRAGMEAVRRGAGDDAFLLGCGLPLGAGVGLVDGMRIGPDVGPWWEVRPDQWVPPGMDGGEPSTRNAWRNTLSRSFQHRRLWLNDPDCVMLRTAETDLSPVASEAWARAVGASGGMALVSDDLSLLGDGARQLLEEVVALGRAADGAARAGSPPRCDDLLDADPPSRLSGPAGRLVADLSVPTARVDPP